MDIIERLHKARYEGIVEKTGELKLVEGRTTVFGCVDCHTRFGSQSDRKTIYCNGHVITLCPWCRPDSEPWKNGRGI